MNNKFTKILLLLITLTTGLSSARAALLINEISTGGSEDWVELKLTGQDQSMDVSSLLVTMYTGTNQSIASSPVTLKSEDDPSTPYDDRFIVVRFTSVSNEDEVDSAGDVNGNGIREAFCDNYGLWNTDCVISIDSDDNPDNGGIIDFAAISNRDGSINSTIGGYIDDAIASSQWNTPVSDNLQDCCIYTGDDGLESWASVSRTSCTDSNTASDFAVTQFSTPGKENIVNPQKKGRKLFKTVKKRIIHRYGRSRGKIEIKLFIFETCSLKIRIFTSTGIPVHSSSLIKDLYPGDYTFTIDEKSIKGKIITGLYPVKIEAVGKENRGSETATSFLIIIKGRQ